jgi:hypothetical protein
MKPLTEGVGPSLQLEAQCHTLYFLLHIKHVRGGFLHVDVFAHDRSDTAYQDRDRQPERNPTSSRGCYQIVPIDSIARTPGAARPASNIKCICR